MDIFDAASRAYAAYRLVFPPGSLIAQLPAEFDRLETTQKAAWIAAVLAVRSEPRP